MCDFLGKYWVLMQPIAENWNVAKMSVLLIFNNIIAYLHNQLKKDATFANFWQKNCEYTQIFEKKSL